MTAPEASREPGAREVLERRFGEILAPEEPLDRHTTMRVGGPARMFFTPRDIEEAADLLVELEARRVPTFVLGGGSNLIVKDRGFDGAVINFSNLTTVRVSGDRIRCGAGAPLARVAKEAMRRNLSGMEGLVGIPGTIGGAVFMNAGGRNGEIADVVESVAALDRKGRLHRLAREQVGFRYRGTGLRDLVVVEAVLKLAPGEKGAILEGMAAVLRKKHQSQPMGKRSAGCVFKNPSPERAAAWLIDQAGLKGERAGGAEVSPRHANFIVNESAARAADVFALIERVRREVLLRFQTPLGLEVKVLGELGLEAA
ncbi:MAG TPA: UDP-N-acetylmuramate dehydrogenase [Planctomycetota bacterium]|nr:UDP-N-acetylmuramate dehydrogenase [Planctomycetota bacterium]